MPGGSGDSDAQVVGSGGDSRVDQSSIEHSETTSRSHIEISSSDSDMNNSTNNSSDVVRRSERARNLSLVGKESKLLELSTALVKSINAQLVVYEELLTEISSLELDTLKQSVSTIEQSFNAIAIEYDEMCSLCDNKPNASIENMFSDLSDEFKLTIDFIVIKIKELEKEEEDQAARIQEAELAMVEAKKKLDEEMANYERIRQRRQNRTSQQLQGSTSTDAAPVHSTANTLAVASESREQTTSVEIPTPAMVAKQRAPSSVLSTTHSHADSDVHVYQVDSGVRAMQNLADQLVTTMKASKRSTLEPAVFQGDPIKFAEWELDFNAYVQSEGLTGIEPLRYLKKFVDGEAKDAISGHIITNTEEAYYAARSHLKKRFGDKYSVSRALRKRLKEWPKIGPRDGEQLRKFADFLLHCQSAMVSMKELRILNDSEENEKLVQKLPDWMTTKWARNIKDSKNTQLRYPNFEEFAYFVADEAEVMSEPVMLQRNQRESNDRRKAKTNHGASTRNFSVATTTEKRECKFCQTTTHNTYDCRNLAKKPYSERIEFVSKNHLCFSCLTGGHKSKTCENKATCKKCSKSHPTVLHKEPEDWNKEKTNEAAKDKQSTQPQNKTALSGGSNKAEPAPEKQSDKRVNVHATRKQDSMLSMVLPVRVSCLGQEKEVLTYALLDTQSDACFMTTEIARQIKPSFTNQQVTICTMNGETTNTVKQFDNIKIRGYDSEAATVISPYEQNRIPCESSQIPTSQNVRNLKHLQVIKEHLPPPMDIPVGLLLGADCPEALAPIESIVGTLGDPFAVRTMLGWTVCGGQGMKARNSQKNLSTKIRVERSILTTMQEDFEKLQRADSHMLSQNDIKFMKIMEQETRQLSDGSYIMPLPFKERPTLPNNRKQAERRLEMLEKKFKKDDKFNYEYSQFMEDLLIRKHAEIVPESEMCKPGGVWYIPHFAVTHPKKRKLRIVFDCSATFMGTSLNEHLLQGPDHINSLLGILCRFRKETIALSCDVERMFYNFLVKPEDRDYLRFLWREEGRIKEYRMTVHLFGAASSPAVATYGLRRLALENKVSLPQASEFICNDFYVDDGITSTTNEEEAIRLIAHARQICAQGNLRLHKFVSNSRKVLLSVPESERSIAGVDLFSDQLPTQRTLGLIWSVGSDELKFNNTLTTKPSTRRGILSTVAQMYDPLGLLSPFTLVGKSLLQRAHNSISNWDEELDVELQAHWNRWVDQLDSLSDINIPRSIKPKDFGDVVKTELHHFCDASLTGYGACSYIRMLNFREEVHCELVLAKARVAPSKGTTTIPRLELQGAVLATRLSSILHREMDMTFDDELFWTDSQIVLGYLNNDIKRFHIFVANRVHEIKTRTRADQWNYIPSAENPADLASRGANISEIKTSKWFSGPDFLWKNNINNYRKQQSVPNDLTEGDPEVRKVLNKITNTKVSWLTKIINQFSSWEKLLRVIARLKAIARHKSFKAQIKQEDITAAQEMIIKNTQSEHLLQEREQLKSSSAVSKRSTIKQLSPFLDHNDQLCVGGRLHKSSDLSDRIKHPVIIPKEAHIATLIIRHHHDRIFHLGRRSTLAAVRSAGFWIISGTGLVKRMLAKCVSCAKLRKPPEEQKMGNLPEERLAKTPPFTSVGMDVFGHFITKDKRTENKRWGLLLTCLYSRAIHIELLEDLSTDAFLNALRCFTAIRGTVRTLVCDHGTNFVGAANELERQLSLANEDSLKEYLLANRIDFKFTSPTASHQGGAYERMIRSVREVLNGMTLRYKSRMDTQTLRTAFYEAMNVVNSRPLTATNINDPDESIVTPNHLLTMKSGAPTPPPGSFESDEVYGRLRWKKVQSFAQEFWLHWRQEYLSYLTLRQKWHKAKQNLKVGDIVIIVEDDGPRGQWKTAIVEEVLYGDDGLVRKAKIRLATSYLDRTGKPMGKPTVLERPIQKLVVLVQAPSD